MLDFGVEFKNIPVLVLAGPTAVGKSALALNVARILNTDIISADSAQIYSMLDIGTAKPSLKEQKQTRHHLINMVNPDENYSVADYQRDAKAIIRDIRCSGKIPFMVGGTGLYIRAVIEGYAFGSKGADQNLRDEYAKVAEEQGLAALYCRLKSIDAEAASKIHPHDRKRIIRALEVYSLEGEPISEQVKKTAGSESGYDAILFGLYMERQQLYKRIEERVDRMMKDGFLQEVEKLYKQGFHKNDPGMQVLGYRQLYAYITGDCSLDDAVSEIKKQTRNLAKRQLTWFRREREIEWLKTSDQQSIQSLSEIICKKVKDIMPARANSNLREK